MMVGGGGWTQAAGRDILRYAEARGVPVAASLRCQDYVDNDHPNYIGHFTIGADPALLKRLAESDLLVALGPRLGEMTTAGYTLLRPPRIGKAFAHVHPDPEELGRVYQPDLAVAASPAVVAGQLAERAAFDRGVAEPRHLRRRAIPTAALGSPAPARNTTRRSCPAICPAR